MMRTPRARPFGIVALTVGAAMVGLPVLSSAQEASLGYVFDVEGTWVVGGDTIHAGRRLSKLDSLRLADRGGAAVPRLVIMAESGERLRVVCEPVEACAGGVVPADSLRDTSIRDGAARVVRAVASLLSTGWREKTVRAAVRGSGFSEAVVASNDGLLDLSPAFQGRPAERVRIALHPDRTPPDSPSRPVLVESASYEPGEALSVPAEGVEPGLYRAVISTGGNPFAPGSDVLVLLADETDLAATRRAFQEAVDVTRGWSGASETEVRDFLRLYLRHLADAGALP